MSLRRQISHISARMRLSEVNRASAEAAFYMIRSAIPLLALSLAIAGRFLPIEEWLSDRTLTALLPAELWRAVGEAAARFFEGPAFAAFLSAGAVLTLWSAATGMRALCRAAVRLAKGRELSYVTAAGRGLGAALLFSALLGAALLGLRAARGFLRYVLFLPMLTLFCVGLTAVFLHAWRLDELFWRRALLTAGAWEVLTLLFGLYLRTVPGASYVYGGIGAILLFMLYVRASLWVYLIPFTLLGPPAPPWPPEAPSACPRPGHRGAGGTGRSKGRRRQRRS